MHTYRRFCRNSTLVVMPSFVSSPLSPHLKLLADMSLKTVDEREYMSHVSYASTVGSLIYVMVCTRPDMSGYEHGIKVRA